MLRVIAWMLGEGNCPACGGNLERHEAGFHECEDCGVAVDFARGAWCFAVGDEVRRLPGMAGLRYDLERGRAA